MTRIFRVNRHEVISRLTDWACSLACDPNIACVVLFGSFARGDCTAASDADILILLRDSPLDFHERISLYRPSYIGVSVDVFPYTVAEARRSLKEGWGVTPVAFKEGKTLYAGAEPIEELAGIKIPASQ